MNKLKTDKGISLIALVITVIVMLLLAFVVTGVINTGLFDRAKKASDLYSNTSDNDPNVISNTIGSLRNLVVGNVIPAEETPTGETPQNKTPQNETPTNETPQNETPTNETPTNEIPQNETPTNETPTNETPTNEIPIIIPTTPDLKYGDVQFTCTPSTWTNGNVTVTISTTITGYTLQYSTDASTWTNYTAGVVYTSN